MCALIEKFPLYDQIKRLLYSFDVFNLFFSSFLDADAQWLQVILGRSLVLLTVIRCVIFANLNLFMVGNFYLFLCFSEISFLVFLKTANVKNPKK